METEIFVRDVVKDDKGEIVVVGEPNSNIPVRVGDLFTLKYELSEKAILDNTDNPIRLNK